MIKNFCKLLLFSIVFVLGCTNLSKIAYAAKKLDKPLVQIEQRLEEETKVSPAKPDSLTFKRAVGELPYRTVSPREEKVKRVLTLDECLQSAFTNSNEIEQRRQNILAVGGSKLVTNSRFLPTIEIINQYEHFRNFQSANGTDDSSSIGALISQRIFEYGKDNPLDITLRTEQRNALFNYENQVASIFSQVRKAFFFVKLKEQQIATRQRLLEGFKKQYEIKQQRMEAGNLSVKIEVLTAKLNVLNEETRINTLKRQQFNRKMDLLRLLGLPVGADMVEFEGQMDSFALDYFDIDGMICLALAQSTQIALGEALVTEQKRTLDQLRYEYVPDLRLTTGYADENGRYGADIVNEDDTWGLDIVGRPRGVGLKEGRSTALDLFSEEAALNGPDPGWFAGIQLRLPLYEGRAREGRQVQNRAEFHRLEAALDDAKDRVELSVRQSYKFLMEQKFQVELAQENVNIEKERFSIKEKLRNVGKITDDELETFRNTFFAAQDALFTQQETLIDRQEDLRLSIRFFK